MLKLGDVLDAQMCILESPHLCSVLGGLLAVRSATLPS